MIVTANQTEKLAKITRISSGSVPIASSANRCQVRVERWIRSIEILFKLRCATELAVSNRFILTLKEIFIDRQHTGTALVK
jgi:hypothetical protein